MLLVVYLALCFQAGIHLLDNIHIGKAMAENMNGLGSKTKYEYPMAKAREGSKSIMDSLFDFVGYSDPIPEYQKSPSKQRSNAEEKGLTKEFDGTSPLDDILPPLSRILEKFNSKLGAITTGYVKPTFSSEPLTVSEASPLLSGTGVSSNDMPPLTPAEQAGVDVALAAQGNGLMARPASDAAPIAAERSALAAPVATPAAATTETSSAFSSDVESIYTAFTAGGEEGKTAHVGLDKTNITLPAGIVADGLKYNGVSFVQGKAEVVGFDKTKLDTSGAYKTVNGTKIKRSDYTSDVDFSKAVLTGFENVLKAGAGDDWSKIPATAKAALVKVGWNLGEGWFSGASAKDVYKELVKTTPSESNLFSKLLKSSTVAPTQKLDDKGKPMFAADGTTKIMTTPGASIGIAKKRANDWNDMRDAFNGTEIVKIKTDNSGTVTKFNYYDKDDKILHTEVTDRAPSLYENGTTLEVKKTAGKKDW